VLLSGRGWGLLDVHDHGHCQEVKALSVLCAIMMTSSEFYSTSAQVIPTLLLVFAIQNRNILTQPSHATHTHSDVLLGALMTVTALLLGEAASIAGLLGVNWSGQAIIVIAGIGLSLHFILGSYVKEARREALRKAQLDERYWSSAGNRITTRIIVGLAYVIEWLAGFSTFALLVLWAWGVIRI
jgi:hypothetical protein